MRSGVIPSLLITDTLLRSGAINGERLAVEARKMGVPTIIVSDFPVGLFSGFCGVRKGEANTELKKAICKLMGWSPERFCDFATPIFFT
jgi:hypothetical protein